MKTMKRIIAASLAGIMLMSLAGCARKIEPVSSRDFKKAVEEVFDDDDYGTYGGSVFVLDDHFAVNFTEFDDEDDARDTWEEALDNFDDMMDVVLCDCFFVLSAFIKSMNQLFYRDKAFFIKLQFILPRSVPKCIGYFLA